MTTTDMLRKMTTRLREIPGGVYAGEYLRKRFGGSRATVEIHDFDGDLSILLDLGEHMQSQIYWHGSYSRNLLFLLRRILMPGMVFVDGGANIGEVSLVAAKRVGPDGRVLSFEPMDRFASQLERNRDANRLTWIDIHRVGLSDRSGGATIYLAGDSFADGTQHDGLGTLFRSDQRSKAAAIVPLVTMDKFLLEAGPRRVDVIKLDVEGGELPALKGARRTLEENSPAVILEIGDDTCTAAGYEMQDILSFLEPFGYAFYRIERRGDLQPIGRSDLRKFQNVYCVKG